MHKSPKAEIKSPKKQENRYSDLQLLFGAKQLDSIKTTKLLVVGAGGIGCELLKNLVMSGFETIEVIDLDTIDLSNLNRQFLFQKQHIKKSKAVIARESVLKFNPNAKITAHHASIFDYQFDLDWFTSFDLCLNALDNLAARRYVNKMCLAADIPLIESGTAGYLGQVSVHKKNEIACYDCSPKEKERRTYPVCTIRSTPSEPIHCIVWAKSYLFTNLFGKAEEEDEALLAETSNDNADEIKNLRKEAEQLKSMRQSIGKKDAGRKIFAKVFKADVDRLLSMEDLWTTRRKPTPLVLSLLEKKGIKMDRTSLDHSQKCWTLQENIHIFLESIDKLGAQLLETRQKDAQGHLEFDKDDETALEFVTATANLRAHIYHIPLQSRFTVKQMAGNIIPAIATTNAIIAGMIVMLAVKLVLGKQSECKYTFLTYGGDRNHFLLNETTPKPNPECQVCTNAYFSLTISPRTTLQQLLDFLGDEHSKPHLEGELTVQIGEKLLYDVEYEDHVEKDLVDLGVQSASQLLVTNDHDDDESKNHSVLFFVKVDESAQDGFIKVGGDLDAVLPTRPLPPQAPASETETAVVEQDTDAKSPKKRKYKDDADVKGTSPSSKKRKGDKVITEVVVLDDDGIKPIELD